MWFSHIQKFEIIKIHCNLLNCDLSENMVGKQDYIAFIRVFCKGLSKSISKYKLEQFEYRT